MIVHIRKDPYDIYIGRAGCGQDGYFGNPVIKGIVCPICKEIHHTPKSTLPCFKMYFLNRVETDPLFRLKALGLRGMRLGCFCAPKGGFKPDALHICHGQIIMEWVDQQPEQTFDMEGLEWD